MTITADVVGACTTPEKYAIVPGWILATTDAPGTNAASTDPIAAPIDSSARGSRGRSPSACA